MNLKIDCLNTIYCIVKHNILLLVSNCASDEHDDSIDTSCANSSSAKVLLKVFIARRS